MKDDEGMSSTTIILGRPFMMTARTKIDVHSESLTMEIGDEKVQFNVLEAMKHLTEDHSLFCIDLLSNVVKIMLLDFWTFYLVFLLLWIFLFRIFRARF